MRPPRQSALALPMRQRLLLRWLLLTLYVATSGPWRFVAVVQGASDPATLGTIDVGHCSLCQGLQYCTRMNGYLLYDPVLGYTREATTQLEKQGVCEDLDAKTLALSKFGDEYQFKDTPKCRELVWNFHCLSWVASTFDAKVGGVPISCVNATIDGPIQLPPCRSLCVEVADRCVYSHLYRTYLENVCGNIPCVSEEEELASKGTKTQRECIKAPWESVPNTTFSRCSIREYVPPKAGANRSWPMLVGMISVSLTLYYVIVT